MRVPDYYAVIVLHPEWFAWSQVHHASNETSMPDQKSAVECLQC